MLTQSIQKVLIAASAHKAAVYIFMIINQKRKDIHSGMPSYYPTLH